MASSPPPDSWLRDLRRIHEGTLDADWKARADAVNSQFGLTGDSAVRPSIDGPYRQSGSRLTLSEFSQAGGC